MIDELKYTGIKTKNKIKRIKIIILSLTIFISYFFFFSYKINYNKRLEEQLEIQKNSIKDYQDYVYTRLEEVKRQMFMLSEIYHLEDVFIEPKKPNTEELIGLLNIIQDTSLKLKIISIISPDFITSINRDIFKDYLLTLLVLLIPFVIVIGFYIYKRKLEKEKQEFLNKENKFLKSILDSISDPFYVIDANNFNIIMANSKATNTWEDRIKAGRTCYSLTHNVNEPCNSKEHPCLLWEVNKTKEHVVVEHKHYDENGKERYFEVHGYPILDEHGNLEKLIEYTVDITPRKEMMEELNMYYKIAIQSPLPIILTDLDGVLKYINPKFTELTGYEPFEVIGKKISIMKSGKTSDETYKTLWSTITSGGTWKGEFPNKKKDGTFYWERAIITPAMNQNGEIFQFIAIKEDITEIKKLNQTVIDMKNLLFESEKDLNEAHRIFKIGKWEHDLNLDQISCSDTIYDMQEWTRQFLIYHIMTF